MYSNFLLTQTYVTINVITDEVVTDMINVTTHVTATAAPVDKESDSELSDPSDPVYLRIIRNLRHGNHIRNIIRYCGYICRYVHIRTHICQEETPRT